MASGPSVICPDAGDFQVPLPRLQSTRGQRAVGSEGDRVSSDRPKQGVLPSLPSNLTSCHDVPPRTTAALCGFGGAARRVSVQRKSTPSTSPRSGAPRRQGRAGACENDWTMRHLPQERIASIIRPMRPSPLRAARQDGIDARYEAAISVMNPCKNFSVDALVTSPSSVMRPGSKLDVEPRSRSSRANCRTPGCFADVSARSLFQSSPLTCR